MKNLCENCNLNYQIEKCRKKLNNLIVEKDMNLLDDKVIQSSQLLDELVYRCVFCETNSNEESGKSLDLKDIFGTHSTFYYYGKEHLFTNMYFYITEGILDEFANMLAELEEIQLDRYISLMPEQNQSQQMHQL